MAENNENPSARKHRIIHWNPDAGREQAARHWTWKRIVAWSVIGFFGLLFAAGIFIRVAKAVFGPEMFELGSAAVARDASSNTSSAFISQAKAEQAHQLAAKALIEVRKLGTDHPVQFQQLVMMQKRFDDAEALLANRGYSRAFTMFDSLQQEMDAFAQNVKIKGEARQAYSAILVRINELELARSLAPGALESAYEAAGAGKKLLDDGNFTGAKGVFDRGYIQLKQAEEALAGYVRENLLNGQRALARGSKEEAQMAFEAALEKSPGNENAIQGLNRAKNIDRVYALLQQGQSLEQRGRFAEAADSYQKAFALDPASAEAQAGQARSARLEKETKFAAAKSAADAAVAAKDWPKAIAEYENALKVYPQKTEVQAMLKSAKENAHKEAVQKSLARAYAFENEHRWIDAREAYDRTLQIEPDQLEAKEGYFRAGTVIRALLQYEKHIEIAEQLADKAEFQAAIRAFNNAMAVKPSYLPNSDRVQQLHALLMLQNQPVDVTFRSDGETWVQISNFRQPTKFRVDTVRMLPGDYHIVGRRKGYRDVQMLLQVRNGSPPPVVTVECRVAAGKI
jgi:tetratricopeptide (TPR) repeat protein